MSAAERGFHAGPQTAMRRAARTAGREMDARNRGHAAADRNRVDPEEPTRGAGAVDRARLSISVSRLVRCGARALWTMETVAAPFPRRVSTHWLHEHLWGGSPGIMCL